MAITVSKDADVTRFVNKSETHGLTFFIPNDIPPDTHGNIRDSESTLLFGREKHHFIHRRGICPRTSACTFFAREGRTSVAAGGHSSRF